MVVDAGSSGSRAHVYEYRAAPPMAHGGLPEVDLPERTLKVGPGLSSFAQAPEGAGAALADLVAFARKEVPEEDWARTPIFLLATAGLRMLPVEDQEAILASCRAFLHAQSPFRFKDEWARVLAGDDEGIYGWVAANYATGALGPLSRGNAARLLGVVELGGASAQVTMLVPPRKPGVPLPNGGGAPAAPVVPVKVGNLDVDLFTHSWLGFGQEAAQAEALRIATEGGSKESPCLPQGYTSKGGVTGTGDYEGCRRLANRVVGSPKACGGPHCLNGLVVPELSGAFLATENFFYTGEFFRLRADAPPIEFERVGKAYCSESWDSVQKRYNEVPEKDLLKYCFSTSYIGAMLNNLGFAKTSTGVRFSNTVTNQEGVSSGVDWPLGALLVEAIPATYQTEPAGNSLFWLWFLLLLAAGGGFALRVYGVDRIVSALSKKGSRVKFLGPGVQNASRSYGKLNKMEV